MGWTDRDRRWKHSSSGVEDGYSSWDLDNKTWVNWRVKLGAYGPPPHQQAYLTLEFSNVRGKMHDDATASVLDSHSDEALDAMFLARHGVPTFEAYYAKRAAEAERERVARARAEEEMRAWRRRQDELREAARAQAEAESAARRALWVRRARIAGALVAWTLLVVGVVAWVVGG